MNLIDWLLKCFLFPEKTYEMNYNVGFMGCDRNEKNEVFPVQVWVVSEFPLDNNGKRGFEDPIFRKY